MSPPAQAINWQEVFNYFIEKGITIEETAKMTLGQIKNLTSQQEKPVQYKTLEQAMKAAMAQKKSRGEA